MVWTERLREAAYTSPSGARFVWIYEDVSRQVDKHTGGFDPAGGAGTFVQDLGRSGYRYPLRVIFSGPDHDLEADAFMAALLERGPGVLEHPRYGRVDAVPFGTITQRDDLKNAANQSVIDVTFWETSGTAYPSDQQDPQAAIVDALDAFNAAGADEFALAVDLDSAAKEATFSARFRSVLDSARSGLQSIADATDEVRARYDAIADSIDQGLDVLVGQPLNLAFQVYQLVQAPAASASLIADKLSAYRDLAASLISGDGAVVSPGGGNSYRSSDLYASGAVSASVSSVLFTEFQTKVGALTAAEEVLDQFTALAAWREANLEALGEVDPGAAYQALQEAVALTAGYLVQVSFSLAQERRVVLDRARTIVDLCAELYQSVEDERLNFLINTNNLTGSEILELQEGATVVYYV